MTIATRLDKPVRGANDSGGSRVTSAQVWEALDRASFGVIGYVTPTGAPRSSGIVYKMVAKRLYIAVASDSWKAKHIAASRQVSVTVPMRRGGILSLVWPIPPATISFHAAAVVHPAGSVRISSLSKQLYAMLPPDGRDAAVVIELIPEGAFLTYGLGIPLMDMRKRELARVRVPQAAHETEVKTW